MCCASSFWKYINSWYSCKIIRRFFFYHSDESYEQECYAELDVAAIQLCTEALNRHQKEKNIILFKEDKYFWVCMDTG